MKKKSKSKPISKSTRSAIAKSATTNALPMADPPVTRKLDLACGQRPEPGFEGVDIWTGAQHVVDLFKFPWPFEDNSVAEVRTSHFLEHVPAVYVDELGNHVQHGGQDLLFRIMDEIWRILTPGGFALHIVPSGRSNRAFQDPTHRRFFVEATFAYFAADWRASQKLDHYTVKCDYGVNVQTTCDNLLNAKHHDVAQNEMQTKWNTTIDFHARMTAVKPARSFVFMPDGQLVQTPTPPSPPAPASATLPPGTMVHS